MMILRLAFLSALLLVGSAACGGDDDDDDDGDDSTVADSGTGGEADAAPGGDSGPEVDSGVKELCGGFAGLTCEDPNTYCDWEDDSCGAADAQGACVDKPAECEPGGDPVCACNGTRYENKCEAARAGEDVAEIGICK
jgi:hypothetical protein